MQSNDNADNITVGNIENSQGVAIGAGATAIVGYTADQVSALVAQITTTFTPKPFDGRCPYLGLDSFDEQDADRFFGREKLVEELVARVRDARYVVIAGPSGSGKSSLMRAGLMHALRQGALPGSERWLYESLKPGRSPIEELARVTASLAGSLDVGNDVRTKGMRDATILHQWAEIALKDRRDRRAVIFVDQFEETFTQVAKEEERVAFLNLLTHAATVEQGRMTVLFAMRSDFVSNVATYSQLNALLNQQFLQVGAMQPDELASAIARPALQVGLRIDADLIAQIMNDMRDEPGALPLMQFALKDLFEAEQAKGGVIALTRAEYLERGGIRKSLERHADAQFAKLSEGEQQLARDVFTGLIQVGRGTQDTRRTALFSELVPAGANAASVETVVRELADARLITTDEKGDARTVTLAHEALIEAWPWLRKLVNENREAIALQNEIAQDAREWDANARDASYLYAGARLATAREQLDAKKIVLSGLAQKFVEAGIRAQEAERRVRQRRVQLTIAGLVIALLAIAAFAFIAFQQRNEAIEQQNVSRSRELASVALNQLNIDPERSILLAVEAVHLSRATQIEEILRKSLVESHVRVVLRGHTDWVNSAVLSVDRRLVVTASNDGSTRVWEMGTGRNVAELRGHDCKMIQERCIGFVNSAVFSPDGKYIVTTGYDGTARVWGANTWQSIAVLRGHTDYVARAMFSPDGKFVITVGDTAPKLWETSTWRMVAELRGHKYKTFYAAFSPDSKLVITAGQDHSARIWEVPTGRNVAELRGHTGEITSVAFNPDGKFVVTSSWDNTARVWEPLTGKTTVELRGHMAYVKSAVFSPDGQFVLTASGDDMARLWEASTGKSLVVYSGHTGYVNSAAFSRDEERIVTTSSDNTARVWDTATGRTLVELRGHTDNVNDAWFSPDGQSVVTVSRDETARVWDTAAGASLTELRGHKGVIDNAWFSLDGKHVVTAGRDDTVRVWDASSGKAEAELRGQVVALSPDAQRVVTTGKDRKAQVWEVSTSRVIAELQGGTDLLQSGALNPYGRFVAVASDAADSPDGKFTVTPSDDNTAQVREVSTGRAVAVLRGHAGHVTSATFSPNGKCIVTGSFDNTARLWEATTGQNLAILRGQASFVNSARFSPDGKFVVTASLDHTAQIYSSELCGSLDELLALARTRVTRELTCEERVQYLHEERVCATPTPTASR